MQWQDAYFYVNFYKFLLLITCCVMSTDEEQRAYELENSNYGLFLKYRILGDECHSWPAILFYPRFEIGDDQSKEC